MARGLRPVSGELGGGSAGFVDSAGGGEVVSADSGPGEITSAESGDDGG